MIVCMIISICFPSHDWFSRRCPYFLSKSPQDVRYSSRRWSWTVHGRSHRSKYDNFEFWLGNTSVEMKIWLPFYWVAPCLSGRFPKLPKKKLCYSHNKQYLSSNLGILGSGPYCEWIFLPWDSHYSYGFHLNNSWFT